MASDIPEGSSEPVRPVDATRQDEEPSLYCPRCNARLAPHRCKLVCQRCGYFMSCAEYH